MNILLNWKRWFVSGVFAVLAFATGGMANAKGVIRRPNQFDLVCQLRGKIVSDPHPTYVGTYPANVKSWVTPARYIVDLTSRKYCDTDCKRFGISPISAVKKIKSFLMTDRDLNPFCGEVIIFFAKDW